MLLYVTVVGIGAAQLASGSGIIYRYLDVIDVGGIGGGDLCSEDWAIRINFQAVNPSFLDVVVIVRLLNLV
jgi:hypothetical protein